MTEFISTAEISRLVHTKKDFPYFPPASDRSFWDNIKKEKKQKLISSAELAAQKPVPMLTAADYMKFSREGNRIAYENPYIERRTMLTQLVLGECAEYKGRFIEEIVEVLWQTVSEPIWCWPAHQYLNGKLLPEPEDWVVDLFAAQTSKLLGDTLQLIGADLEKDFAPLCNRVRYEISHRVLEITEKYTDSTCWWYGGDNNWSIWCCYSITCAALSVWNNDPERLSAYIAKHMIPCQRFFDKYNSDGSCPEGPSYWAVSVGMMMNYLNLIQKVFGGMENILNSPKTRSMAEFIVRLNLYGSNFLNFADAEMNILKFPRGLFYTYGKLINSPQLMAMAQNMPSADPALQHLGNRDLNYFDEAIYELELDNEANVQRSFNAADFWNVIQIGILRQNPEDPEKGTVCTIKGGHNAESHGHFDLGNVTVHHNGKPIVIDVGRGQYNQKVFSENRYDIWFTNNFGHNIARFNNCNQGIGREFECFAEFGNDSAIYDITRAYKAEDKINSYIRRLDFDRNIGTVNITDKASFEGRKDIDISFFSPIEPCDVSENSLTLGTMKLECSGIKITYAGEYPLNDVKLETLWHKLYKIDLQVTADSNAEYKISFKPLN